MTTLLVRTSLKAMVAMLCTLLASAHAWATSAYTVVPFDFPGSGNTTLSGINDSGSIVGSFSIGPDGSLLTGFVYRDGAFSTVAGPAGSVSSAVRGISNSGLMVGSFATDGVALTRQSFLFDGTSYTVLALPFGEGAARSISPNGRYVAGDVFGNRSGFVHDLATGQTQTFGAESLLVVAQGVNDQGQVVGSRTVAVPGVGAETRPFLFDAVSGAFVDNPESYPGLIEARPRAINNNGVVGGYTVSGGAFIREGSEITTLSFEAVSFSTVSAINSHGVAVGYTTFGAGPGSFNQGFMATPVPEPASLGQFLLGGTALWALRRRTALAPAHPV